MTIEGINTIYIVGPTASGKSDLGIQIAKELNGEIICADSRTIYKNLDIATAKPSPDEQREVKHWCLDVVEPNERYSAAQFKRDAQVAIKDILSRSKLPIIVGGSGLYIDGLLYDYKFGPLENEQLRSELELMTIEQLQELISAKNIETPENNKNKRYLIRAIEQGGINKKRGKLKNNILIIGINPGVEILEERITKRAKSMLKNGAVDEAKMLFEKHGENAPATLAPFYKAIKPHFINLIPIEDCVAQYIKNDRNLAKRQIAWFKRNKAIKWFKSSEEALNFVHSKLK